MTEIWKSLKDIVEFGESYEVSNLGNVRSIDKEVKSRYGTRIMEGKILTKASDKDGYLQVQFYEKQKFKLYRVHRLVAMAFIPNPDDKPHVNHKDGVKDNNNLENLEWATMSENRRHAFDTGLQNALKGEDNPNAKLTDEKILEIYNLYKTNEYSLEDLAKIYDSSPAVLSTIFNGKSWTHLNLEGYKRVKSIITDELTEKVILLHDKGLSKRAIEREVGVSRTTVSKILDNRG